MKYRVLTGLDHFYCKPYDTNTYIKALIALLYRKIVFGRGWIVSYKHKIMANKYRIIEERTSVTKKSVFYIQKRRRFLFWTYWTKTTMYSDIADSELVMSYDSFESAKKDLDRFNDKIETIIHKEDEK